VDSIRNLRPRTSNAAESFNACVNRACPPNSAFWHIVDVLHRCSKAIGKEIKLVRSGKLPERSSHRNGKAALDKLKEIRRTTRFELEAENLLEALSVHSKTDWADRPMRKNFDDVDAILLPEEEEEQQ